MPSTYGYARVSSPRQRDEGVSLEDQQEKLPKIAAEKFPDYEYKGTFWDAQSASVLAFASRKEGRKLNSLLERGDIVVVVNDDRIFRSPHDYYCSERLYKERGVAIYLANMNISIGDVTLDPAGEFFGGIMAAKSRMESRLLSGRVHAALDYLYNRAVFWHTKLPHGWRIDADRRLWPDEAYRAKIARLYEIRQLNCWNNTDLWIYCRQAGILNRNGKPWDLRRLMEAFRCMRLGWPLPAVWTLGPEGHAVPLNWPSLTPEALPEPLPAE